MGRPKELLLFDGETLLERTIATLSRCTEPIVVAARHEQPLPRLPSGVDRIDDRRPGDGPLAAIAGALDHLRRRHAFTDDDAVFVTGCDAPFLTNAVVQFLALRLGDAKLCVPRVGGVLQPLCAVWRLAAGEAIGALLADGILAPRRVAEVVATRVVEEDDLRTIDPELRASRSVNSPEEYQRALAERRP